MGRGGRVLLRRPASARRHAVPLRIHSMVGLLPVLPAASVPRRRPSSAPRSASTSRASWRMRASRTASRLGARCRRTADGDRLLLSLLPPVELERVLARGRSTRTRSCRRTVCVRCRGATATTVQRDGRGRHGDGRLRARRVDDRPLRRQLELARSGLVPGQLPVHRIAAALGRRPRARRSGRVPDGLRAPAAAARRRRDLATRLVSIWLPDAEAAGRSHGAIAQFRDDPEWRDLLLFHEYFHGDTGPGIGASHQTGWTGLVAHLLCRGGTARPGESAADGRCREPVGTIAARSWRRNDAHVRSGDPDEAGAESAGRGPSAGLVLASLIAVAAVANLNLSVANVALPSIGPRSTRARRSSTWSPSATRSGWPARSCGSARSAIATAAS